MNFFNILRIVVLGCLVLSGLYSIAQDYPLKFNHISYKEGLSQSPIGAIFQDKKGFIWIGNREGLTRYDGYEFVTYSHKEGGHNSLSHNLIRAITQDSTGMLWIGTSNGLNVFDPVTEKFTYIDISQGKTVSAVLIDEQQYVWVASYDGLKRVDYEAIDLSFLSRFNTNSQEDQLSVHISTDFDGVYTFDNISNNTSWTNITGEFILGGATNRWDESGIKNIKDIIENRTEGKPLYLAFKYTFDPTKGVARIWRVRDVSLTGTTVWGTSTITDHASAGWIFVDNSMDTPGRSTIEGPGSSINPGGIMLANGNNGANVDKPMEAWAVSKAFDVGPIDYGSDKAISIKRIVDPQLTTYQHTYVESGTYEVVFVAANVDGEETKEAIRTIEITIP